MLWSCVVCRCGMAWVPSCLMSFCQAVTGWKNQSYHSGVFECSSLSCHSFGVTSIGELFLLSATWEAIYCWPVEGVSSWGSASPMPHPYHFLGVVLCSDIGSSRGKTHFPSPASTDIQYTWAGNQIFSSPVTQIMDNMNQEFNVPKRRKEECSMRLPSCISSSP